MEIYVLVGFYVIILIYSIILHEVSHGVAALWLGDRTAKDSGRITLEPVSHMDPVGSVIVPVSMILLTGFAFGWAKPVPYNPFNLRWRKWGEVFVAFAGPATNFLIAAVAAGVGYLISIPSSEKLAILNEFSSGFRRSVLENDLAYLVAGDFSAILFLVCAMVIFWNVVLGVFNLLPIPPLDGSKLLFTLVPMSMEKRIFLEKYGLVIVLVFLFTPFAAPFHMALAFLWNFFFNLMI